MEDCYFFIDFSVPYEERKISVCCVPCKEKHFPDTDMFFYEGTKEGYGPYDYKCCKCGKLVHRKEEFMVETEEIEENVDIDEESNYTMNHEGPQEPEMTQTETENNEK